ncbi:MAG: nucleotide exchange factor GrpE [Parcubacteria group bacterium]|jgi:molecular chaperone GrpE
MTEKNEEKEVRFGLPIAQKVLFYDESQKKFLLLKIKNETGFFAKKYGAWEIAGGKIEQKDATLEDALQREVMEELGQINYEISSIVSTQEVFYGDGSKIIFLNYLAKYEGGEIKISDEHSEYRWLTAENIISGKEYGDWIKNLVKKANIYLENQNTLDSWKRCQADFENYKKDQMKHQEEFRKYAKMDVLEQILPVVDNFEASLAHVPGHSKENKWVEGIVYIKKQLEDILKNNDIEEIEVKAGDKFNPEVHEAVGGDGKKQKVAKVIQKGYKLNGRIIRAAKVEVS